LFASNCENVDKVWGY